MGKGVEGDVEGAILWLHWCARYDRQTDIRYTHTSVLAMGRRGSLHYNWHAKYKQ